MPLKSYKGDGGYTIKMNFAISYSGGKDSALALYRMINEGHCPVALITAINTKQKRSWFHGIQNELLQMVSASLRIPLLTCECDSGNYGQAYEESLKKARKMGADCCVFGDIDIEEHKYWNEERCKSAGLNCILPLWRQGREELVLEIISIGFKAMIKIVQSNKLDESFLGQDLTFVLIEKMRAAGIDVCGENGEYHTFVYDGPVFSYPITVKAGEIVDIGTHKAVNIVYKD